MRSCGVTLEVLQINKYQVFRNAALFNAAARTELFPTVSLGVFPLLQGDFEEQGMHPPLPPGIYQLVLGLDQEGKPFIWGNAKRRWQAERSRDGLPHLGVGTNRSLLGSPDSIGFIHFLCKVWLIRRAGGRRDTEQPQHLAQTFQQCQLLNS